MKLPVRPALSICALVCSVPFSAFADFTSTAWQFRRAIQGDGTVSIASVKIDPIVYRGSRAHLADIRVLREGVERPYVLDVLRGTTAETELQPRIVNMSMIPGSGLEFTLDLGMPVPHNRARYITREHNFKYRVRIETSNDDRHWALVREDGYIFDFSQDGRRMSVLSIDYPASNRRYTRTTIYGLKDPKFIDSALLTRWQERTDTRETYASFDKLKAVQDPKTQSSLYTIDLGFEGLPHDVMEFEIAPALFYRAMEIETSNNGKDWNYAGQGVIFRTPEQRCLTASFGEVWDRYLRFRIMNRDDQPLSLSKVAIQTIVRQIKFQAGGAGEYWLAYGNPDARAPAYDFSSVISNSVPAVSPAALGPEQANPVYRPKPPETKPWSDRHPGVLYGVLASAIAAMGFVTIRFLMKVSNGSGG